MEPNGVIGAFVIALMFDWGFLGILLVQIYLYYLTPEAETPRPMWSKVLVYTVLVLELAQVATTSADIYQRLSVKPGDLQNVQLLWLTIPIFGGLTGGIGQFFFAYRIWTMCNRIGDSIIPPLIIITLGTLSVVGAFVSAGKFKSKDVIEEVFLLKPSVGIWNGFGAVCDIVIALSMPYYLMRTSRAETSRAIHGTIVSVVQLVVETGMFTAAIAVLHVILYFIASPTFLVPGIIISKIYANTMLVLQNNQIKIVNRRVEERSENDEAGDEPKRPIFVQNEQLESNARDTGSPLIGVGKKRLLYRMNRSEDPPEVHGLYPSYGTSSARSDVLDTESELGLPSTPSPARLHDIYHQRGSSHDYPMSNVSETSRH
ncbi:hypothetical protein CPB83DRAFT_887038 [Crepidotus variabilis]|uniref:DUF6534 domain-containing protein n=1 Tax=Crepidotus variabilis TaxID=179855 RepID=A0A9P6E6A3_9AGAR|nr:hypothetical protein CPB83DRAFT_887038 [Crepidotus variabilis]